MPQRPPDHELPPLQMPRVNSVLLPDFCTDEQLSRFLGIPAPEVVAAIERGEIPASRVAGRYVIDREAFADSLRGSRRPRARRAGGGHD